SLHYSLYLLGVSFMQQVSLVSKWTDEQARRFYKSTTWKYKRLEILKRDNYECVHCKEQGRLTTHHDATLEIDHIKELKDYPQLRLTNSNLQTLCRTCHNIKHERHIEQLLPYINKPKWDDEKW